MAGQNSPKIRPHTSSQTTSANTKQTGIFVKEHNAATTLLD